MTPRPKTGKKTATSPRSGATIPTGAHPGNTGGKKGRSGRKPEAFRALCRALVSSQAVLDAARSVLSNPDHPAWTGALKWATENGYGKAPQPITGPDGGPVQIQQVWKFGSREIKF